MAFILSASFMAQVVPTTCNLGEHFVQRNLRQRPHFAANSYSAGDKNFNIYWTWKIVTVFTTASPWFPPTASWIMPTCYIVAITFRLNTVRSPSVASRPTSRTSMYISRLSHAPSIFRCTTLLELLPQMRMSKNYEKSLLRNFMVV